MRRFLAGVRKGWIVVALFWVAGCRSLSMDPEFVSVRSRSVGHETAYTPGKPLNAEEAVARAIACSGTLSAQEARVEEALVRWRWAADRRDPELRIMAGEDRFESERYAYPPVRLAGTDTGEADFYRIGLRLFPPNPWERSARISAARAEFLAAGAELRRAEQQVAAEVLRAFSETLYAEQEGRLLKELTALQKTIWELTKDLLVKGQATLVQDVAASRGYMRSLSDSHQAARRLFAARRNLATLLCVSAANLRLTGDGIDLAAAERVLAELGIKPVASQPTSEAGARPRTIDLSELNTKWLKAAARRRRADMTAARWRAVAAEAAYREARSARIPWLTHIELSYGWGSDSAEQYRRSSVAPGASEQEDRLWDTTFDEAENYEWRIGLGIRVPLFSCSSRTPAACDHARRQAEERRLEARRRLASEIWNAVCAVNDIAQRREHYKSETGPLLRKMQSRLEQVEGEEGLAHGERLRIREQILLSRHLELQTDFEYRLAIVDLLQSLGALPATRAVKQGESE